MKSRWGKLRHSGYSAAANDDDVDDNDDDVDDDVDDNVDDDDDGDDDVDDDGGIDVGVLQFPFMKVFFISRPLERSFF